MSIRCRFYPTTETDDRSGFAILLFPWGAVWLSQSDLLYTDANKSILYGR